MNHDICQEKLIDLVYGELATREAGEVEAHLGGCADCRGAFERLSSTRRTMAKLPTETAPEHGEHLLLTAARHAVEARGHAKRKPLLPLWAWRASLSAAVVMLVGTVSVSVYLSSRSKLSLPSPERPAELAVREVAGDAPVAAPGAPMDKLAQPKAFATAPPPERSEAKRSKAPTKDLGKALGAAKERENDGFMGSASAGKGSGAGGALSRYAEPPPPMRNEPLEAPAAVADAPAAPAAPPAAAEPAPQIGALYDAQAQRGQKKAEAPSKAGAQRKADAASIDEESRAPAAARPAAGSAMAEEAAGTASQQQRARAQALWRFAQQRERDGDLAAAAERYGELVRDFRGHPLWRPAAEARVRLLKQLGRGEEAKTLESELR